MEKFKKFIITASDYLFYILILMTIMWGMLLTMALTIEIPTIGITFLLLSIFILIGKEKHGKEK